VNWAAGPAGGDQLNWAAGSAGGDQVNWAAGSAGGDQLNWAAGSAGGDQLKSGQDDQETLLTAWSLSMKKDSASGELRE